MATDTLIMFESQFQQDLFEDAARRLGISITELKRHARRICLDPVQVKGPRITLIDDVPLPSANVDLRKAWERMRTDDDACEHILTHAPSIPDVLRAIRNQLKWMRFCAARCEAAEDRDVYRTLTAFREATIRALAARCRTKSGGQAMANALEAVLAGEAMQ